jgi:ferritin
VDVGAEFDFPAINVAKPDYQSPLDAVEKALAWERSVTRQFNEMCAVALENKDFTSFQFLQWFIEEQVEEEALMSKYIQMIKGGSDLFVLEEVLGEVESAPCDCDD